MTRVMKTIIYPVNDLGRAKVLYSELLGVQPIMDEAYTSRGKTSVSTLTATARG